MIKYAIEFVVIVGFVGFFISQVIVPLIRNTKLFPLFSKEAKLKSRIVEVNQTLREQEIQKDLDKLSKKVR